MRKEMDKMRKNRKHLFALMLGLAVLLLVGFVYAAITGTLIFNGNVTLGADLELTIVPTTATATTSGGSTGTMTLIDGQNAEIDVNLTEPGESVTLSFKVENTGSLDALINGITTANTNTEFVISGDYTDLDNEVVAVGTFFPLTEVDITVTWPITGDANTDAGDYTFTITINYEVAP